MGTHTLYSGSSYAAFYFYLTFFVSFFNFYVNLTGYLKQLLFIDAYLNIKARNATGCIISKTYWQLLLVYPIGCCQSFCDARCTLPKTDVYKECIFSVL